MFAVHTAVDSANAARPHLGVASSPLVHRCRHDRPSGVPTFRDVPEEL